MSSLVGSCRNRIRRICSFTDDAVASQLRRERNLFLGLLQDDFATAIVRTCCPKRRRRLIGSEIAYTAYQSDSNLLVFQGYLFVFVTRYQFANLRWFQPKLRFFIGEKGFLGAVRALSSVEAFKATAQAGMTERNVTSTVTGQLIEHVRYLDCILICVHLPLKTKIVSRQLIAAEDGRKAIDFERGSRMVSRNLIFAINPLCIAHRRGG